VHVLVLSESTNRNHLGLYGYGADTTPRLSARADELFVFTDVVSPHSHTIPTLKKFFTFHNAEASGQWHAGPVLLDVMNAAGYKTYWISNQEAYGIFGDVASAIASRADVRVFHNRGSTERQGDGRDAELLVYLDRILERDPAPHKFIVLHLMGTHSIYRKRYPPEFEHFAADDVPDLGRDFLDEARRRTIAQYDNAVRYSDFVIDRVVERLANEKTNAYLLYLADHGEEVYDARDFKGHIEGVGNRHMIEIPFVLWLSRTYRDAHPERVASIAAQRSAPYMTDDVIHTILDLSDVAAERAEPARSLVHPSFDPSRRRVYAGRDYEQLRHDDAPILIGNHFDKLWAHRVNSLGKLEQLQRVYTGVELDVVIEVDADGAARFDVNHPPAESIALSLDTYLAQAAVGRTLSYWLDIKNLDEANWRPAVERLRELMGAHGLSGARAIAESTNATALRHLSEAGFRTSLYLPYLKLDQMSTDQLERRAAQLANDARTASAKALSFPGYMLDYVSREIRPRAGDLPLLTWYPRRSLANPQDAPFLEQVIDREAVQVVLVGHRTKYDR
jgi:heptose-I-phosphate ethanolaminephosphotransferase